jgi:CheY-like chemotaxis protein
MPGEDDYALIQRVWALPRDCGKREPAVALTADIKPEDRRRALADGFQTHAPKSVDPGGFVLASQTRLPAL